MEAIPKPEEFEAFIEKDPSLSQARKYVRDARDQQIGIFDDVDPLALEPFELRYLARRQAPPRRVIDMTADDSVLLKPTNYYQIPNSEDRFFVNPEHVPLFKEQGYTMQT